MICVCVFAYEWGKKRREGTEGHTITRKGQQMVFPHAQLASECQICAVLCTYTRTHPCTHVSHHWRMQSYAVSGRFRVVWQQWVLNTKTTRVHLTLSCHTQNNQLERLSAVSEWLFAACSNHLIRVVFFNVFFSKFFVAHCEIKTQSKHGFESMSRFLSKMPSNTGYEVLSLGD